MLKSKNTNKAYLPTESKNKDVYRIINSGHMVRLRCDFAEAL